MQHDTTAASKQWLPLAPVLPRMIIVQQVITTYYWSKKCRNKFTRIGLV